MSTDPTYQAGSGLEQPAANYAHARGTLCVTGRASPVTPDKRSPTPDATETQHGVTAKQPSREMYARARGTATGPLADATRSARPHEVDAQNCSGSVAAFVDLQADMRRQFVAACKAWRVAVARAEAAGLLPGDRGWPSVSFQPFAGLRCGARTKGSGMSCKLLSIYSSGRCKFHGGMSSGPRSAAGKARAALNGCCSKRTPSTPQANPMRD